MSSIEKQLTESLYHSVENKHPSGDMFGNILNSLDKTKKNNNKGYLYMKRTLSSVAALVILIGILISFAFVSPAMAAVVRNIPVVGSIFEYMGDNGLKDAKKHGVVSTIYKVAEDQGIRITINDALYDDARIVISFKEECEGEFKNFLGMDNDILVNDKLAPDFGIDITEKKISEGIYVGLLTININDPTDVDNGLNADPKFFSGELPDEFTLGFHVSEIEGVKGNWIFDIPVSKVESKKMTTKYEPKISKTYKDATLTLEEVIFAPSCVGLTFGMEPFGGSDIASYRVYDDKGKQLEVICESIMEPLYLPVREIPKSLKIVPYTSDIDYTQIPLPEKYPVAVSQGNLGDVIIQKIEFLADKTLIYYDFKPKDSSVEPSRIRIVHKKTASDGGTNFWLEGFPKGPNEKLKAPIKTGENSYVQEYKAINPGKNLYLKMSQTVDARPIKEFEMTVSLENPI